MRSWLKWTLLRVASVWLGQTWGFLKWVWINTYKYHFLWDEHPFTSYFDVHQGYKVLTHCQIGPQDPWLQRPTWTICGSVLSPIYGAIVLSDTVPWPRNSSLVSWGSRGSYRRRRNLALHFAHSCNIYIQYINYPDEWNISTGLWDECWVI